jgi:hypothetical protein
MSSVDWENRYQQADTPWDKGLPHPMIESWRGLALAPGAIVVPGCGRGWDLRAWAMMFPQHRVLGIDLAASAVEDAQKNCADLSNVRVILADFFDHASWRSAAELEGQNVSLVWEHTCFCAIPPSLRETYAATVAYFLPTFAMMMAKARLGTVRFPSSEDSLVSTSTSSRHQTITAPFPEEKGKSAR